MTSYLGLFFLVLNIAGLRESVSQFQNDSSMTRIKKTADFTITGEGDSPSWNKASWIVMSKQESSSDDRLTTQAKVLYSNEGLYFLFYCEDKKITATFQEDFAPLFKEDVVEVFLWPDQSAPVYFEYEISPLNYELPILIPNLNGKIGGWRPSHYEGKRKVVHATSVQGGQRKNQEQIKSWSAEFFIPFALLSPIITENPSSGSRWRANLYRIDYDDGYNTWSWQKTTVGKPGNFHEYKKFGTFIFD